MREIVIIDTSIFLNILDIPGRNQDRESILDETERLFSKETTSILLPLATILESGNHIAHVSDGRMRRQSAHRFAEQVEAAVNGRAPWRPTRAITSVELSRLMTRFPDAAMREIGLGDLSIVHEWETACELHPRYRVRIWSLDRHLAGYDRVALD